MNRSIASALAIAAAALAGNAFADDITIDTQPLKSVKSRTEVQADLKKPTPNYWSSQYNMTKVTSNRSSKELTDEYIAARREVAALNGEDSGSAYFSRAGYRGNTSVLGGPGR
jgi:hypothetical protein